MGESNLFVAMYVRQEAVLSSQIEGTQASLTDVLEFEAGDRQREGVRDASEVVNYIGALTFGLNRVKELPLSLRLLREIHSQLMRGVRGEHRDPGEFRRIQNWIGGAGVRSPAQASFVPPPPHEGMRVLGELETFLHADDLPVLVHAGLAHAQFETRQRLAQQGKASGNLIRTLDPDGEHDRLQAGGPRRAERGDRQPTEPALPVQAVSRPVLRRGRSRGQ
ncbi:MAG: Fic/DOC family N-terminal domain-containing protein [Anaeromyxobacteraceae bacterium]